MANLPFERQARFVLAAGIDAARSWGHPAVRPAHLLVGVLRHTPEVLPELDPTDVEHQIRSAMGAGKQESGHAAATIPYDASSKDVLAAAVQAARKAGHRSVLVADLIQALRLEGDDHTSAWLGRKSKGRRHRPTADDGENLDWLRMSDESDDPYHQQVAEQLRDAIATGRLVPGQRLPTVRRLAETLDLAPGTVAKAYRALDAEGVIRTAGSKGTLVAMPKSADGNSGDRIEALANLLRPVAVGAFHMGASAGEFRKAVDRAVVGVLEPHDDSST